jgi:hypothetical protein
MNVQIMVMLAEVLARVEACDATTVEKSADDWLKKLYRLYIRNSPIELG